MAAITADRLPFIGEGRWDDDALVVDHQRMINKTPGGENERLIVGDGSDFPAHGGQTDNKDNCQAGVFVGCWFAEKHCALWQDRRIPGGITFQRMPELAASRVGREDHGLR